MGNATLEDSGGQSQNVISNAPRIRNGHHYD
jgi:hypothetical protein